MKINYKVWNRRSDIELKKEQGIFVINVDAEKNYRYIAGYFFNCCCLLKKESKPTTLKLFVHKTCGLYSNDNTTNTTNTWSVSDIITGRRIAIGATKEGVKAVAMSRLRETTLATLVYLQRIYKAPLNLIDQRYQ